MSATHPEIPTTPDGFQEDDFDLDTTLPARGEASINETVLQAIGRYGTGHGGGDGRGGEIYDALPSDYTTDLDWISAEDWESVIRASGYECSAETIGNLGEVYTLLDNPSDPEADSVGLDIDDTTISFTQKKSERDRHFSHALTHNWGVQVTPETQSKMMSMTNAFARWSVHDRTIYNIDAHKAALMDAVNLYAQLPEGTSDDEYFERLEHRLEQLRNNIVLDETQAATRGQEPRDIDTDLPFYFYHDTRHEGHTLKIVDPNFLDEVIDEVFEPMYEPDIDPQTAEAVTILNGLEEQYGVKVNINFFTYGRAPFQIAKALESLDRLAGDDSQKPVVSEIWVTQSDKGQFFETAQHSVVPGQKSPDSIDVVSGDDMVPRSYVMNDDDSKELDAILAHNSTDGLSTLAIRHRRRGTKNYEKEWNPEDGIDGHVRQEYDPEADGRLIERILKTLLMQNQTVLSDGAGTLSSHAEAVLTKRVNAYEQALAELKIDDEDTES